MGTTTIFWGGLGGPPVGFCETALETSGLTVLGVRNLGAVV